MALSPVAPRVLVVDDEADFRRLLVEFLSVSGFECMGAASGKEALAILGKESFDLGVFDIVMPGMNGRDLAVRAYAVSPSMRLVAVSARECSPESIDCGFQAAVLKPLDIDAFLRICQGLVQRVDGAAPAGRTGSN